MRHAAAAAGQLAGRCRSRSDRLTRSRAVSTCRLRSPADIGNSKSGNSTFCKPSNRQQVVELEDKADVPVRHFASWPSVMPLMTCSPTRTSPSLG